MADNDLLLRTIEAVYASGLDSGCLPNALELTGQLLGATGATFEIFNKRLWQHREFCSVGIPTVARTPYLEHYAALNPRARYITRQNTGHVICDYQVLDEAHMGRDAFYAEFLANLGLRYFAGAVLKQTSDEITVISIQRSRKQGHVDKREVTLMRCLVPHFQRADGMASRLKFLSDDRVLLENALDWLADAVALLRADGSIVYANGSLRTLAKRGDGLRIVDRDLEFAAPEARRSFQAALAGLEHPGDPSCDARPADFPVTRADGMPAYLVSVRPLVRAERRTVGDANASVMLFIRDPLHQSVATTQILKGLFGLTNAEAHLAQALAAARRPPLMRQSVT